MDTLRNDKIIILFDGMCNLCDSVVFFIIHNDKRNVFRFVPIESDLGKKIRKEFQILNRDYIVTIKNKRIYTKSDAVIEILVKLKFPVNMLSFLYFIPRVIRNYIYNIVSKNRYKWFGKKKSCTINQSLIKEKSLRS